jgi:hypothetical protein
MRGAEEPPPHPAATITNPMSSASTRVCGRIRSAFSHEALEMKSSDHPPQPRRYSFGDAEWGLMGASASGGRRVSPVRTGEPQKMRIRVHEP